MNRSAHTSSDLTQNNRLGGPRWRGNPIGLTLCGLIAAFFLSSTALASATVVAQRSDGLYLIEGSSPQEIYSGFSQGMGVSPNGEEVVITPSEGENAGDLMIYNIPEEETTVVSSHDEESMYWREPRFAPSGTQIVAASDLGLYAIDIDGTHIRRLTGNAGEPSWPVMSRSGHLAYLDNKYNLWVLDPTAEEEASKPRLIAAAAEHEVTFAYPPSFGVGPSEEEGGGGEEEEASRASGGKGTLSSESEPDLILYPTDKSNYIYDVKTGEERYNTTAVHNGPEWNTEWPFAFWEAQYNNVYRVNRFTGEPSFIGSTPSSPYEPIIWIRSEQLPGEVSIPHAAIPEEELIEDFTPYVKYDSQEPYGAVHPRAITDVYGWNEGFSKVLYTNRLRRGERILAEPPRYEWMDEVETTVKYEPAGIFPLVLENLGATYPAFSAPDENGLASSEDFIDEHNDTHEEDSALAYSEGRDYAIGVSRPAEDGLWLQYWFFYYYNNGTVGVDDHEGDWEMIQVHLNEKTGYLPTDVVYAQHSHGNRCEHGEYETEGLAPGPGGAPVVYVANGDHASYPEEGEWESEVPFVHDSVFPNLEEWPSAHMTLLGVDPESPPGWLEWPGEWGASANSPPGPEFQGAKWDEPTTWAEEAEGCFDNKVFERHGASATRGTRASIALKRPVIHDGRLRVGYQMSGVRDKRPSWPRMLLSVDALNDRFTPKTIIVKNIKKRSRVLFPFRLKAHRKWRVRASVVSRQGRTPVVARWAIRR
jgi:hypothetical protein